MPCLFVEPVFAKNTAPWVGESFWGTTCIGAGQGYGPFDYTQRYRFEKNLNIVEDYHFTPNVENLASGNSGSVMSDIDYTLRAWPNHHRALNSVSRLRLINKEKRPSPKFPPAECYLQRAINYSPNDAVSHMLFAILQHRMGYLDGAESSYRRAESLEPDNLQLKYNVGLFLFDLRKYDESLEYARDVYAEKFPLPGLRRKLEEKGYALDSTE